MPKSTSPRDGADHEPGVVFPAGPDGRRSTQALAREVLADATRGVDPALARGIEAERDWRKHYATYLRRLTALGASASDAELAIADAGLGALHDRFAFRVDGSDRPLAEALRPHGRALERVTIRGDAPRSRELAIPYAGDVLRGAALHRRLDAWCESGAVEPSFAQAIRLVAANPDWLDLTDLRFVLLGAAAEMGPLAALCRWGADVHAVDRRNAAVTSRIVAAARGGAGRVTVPADVTGGDGDPAPSPQDLVERAGADLLVDVGELRDWIEAVDVPSAGSLVLGNYVYADGATFMRLSMAVDVLAADLLARRPHDVALAYLATPTDVFAVPMDAVEDARRRAETGGRARRSGRAVLHRASRGHAYVQAYADLQGSYGVADALVVQQGPNYALAKRLQRWRAVLARTGGAVTSANVAPPTRTRSVTSNRLLANAYAGAHRFGIEIFEPATSSTLMAAMLVHDLRNPAAASQPSTQLGNPAELFMAGAAHGGLWRIPWEPRSVLGLAVVGGAVRPRHGG